MTVKDIVRKWLKRHEYGSLSNIEYGCTCDVDDLMTCDGECDISECEPDGKE
jgi:hypothetical protein